jgi:thioredoxin reductase (NADPH)
MSRYLISRIEASSGITLKANTEIEALEGETHLERIYWRDKVSGKQEGHDIRHVFVMTGAEPNSAWLGGCLATDARHFIKTGADAASPGWPLQRSPYLLETSRPGVFAVGDIRAGSVKRVAAAVGEGSMAIQFVHKTLAE